MENIELLVRELCNYTEELPWLEFKHDNYTPETIGEDISALANGAALDEKSCAYFLWGIDDVTDYHVIAERSYPDHNIYGTRVTWYDTESPKEE